MGRKFRERRRGLGGLALLAKGGCLADALAEEVERGAASVPAAHDLDLLDSRRVHQEGALDADAVADPSHRHLTIETAVAQTHHGAFERLRPLAVPLHDADRDAHGVA